MKDADRLARDMYMSCQGLCETVSYLGLRSRHYFIIPALFILHVSYPVALMVVVSCAVLIPMVGHTIGAHRHALSRYFIQLLPSSSWRTISCTKQIETT